MKEKINKKGELTSQQLITIIILIVSFSVILIFFFSLNFIGTIDRESCKNSVALKGTFSFFGGGLINLKCKTQDICFNAGDKCDIDGAENIEIKSDEQLLREISGLMASCWNMMGEGKIDYADKGSCAICYKIYFDEKLQKILGEIDYSMLYNKMTENMPEGEQSYLFYLYKLSSPSVVQSRLSNQNINFNEKWDFSKRYVIVTGISDEQNPPVFIEFNSENLKNKALCSDYVTEI